MTFVMNYLVWGISEETIYWAVIVAAAALLHWERRKKIIERPEQYKGYKVALAVIVLMCILVIGAWQLT